MGPTPFAGLGAGPARQIPRHVDEGGSRCATARTTSRGRRQRILEAAGRRFKQDGIDGAGVAAVMSDAGLTNGAFYGHFASKEDLVANVLADQLRAQRHSFDGQPADRAGLEAFMRSYLSPEHRDQCADGCPSAALLDEIGRRPAATRAGLHRRADGRHRRHRVAP